MGVRGYFEVGTHSVMMLICEQTQEMVAAASASEVQVWDWAGSKHLVSLYMGGGGVSMLGLLAVQVVLWGEVRLTMALGRGRCLLTTRRQCRRSILRCAWRRLDGKDRGGCCVREWKN